MFKKIFGSLLLLVFFFSFPALALYLKTGDSVVIPKDMVINDNLFAAGGTVEVYGTITGDLIAFGGKVLVSGNIERNILVGGGEVVIDGIVKNDMLVGCGRLVFTDKSRVGKDAFIGCGEAKIDGKIFRDLKIGAGSAMVGSGAVIKGKLDHSVDNMDISDMAKVLGKITFHPRPKFGQRAARFFGVFFLVQKFLGILSVILLGILFIVFLPNQIKLVNEKMIKSFWVCLGWGILSLIVIPLIGGLLMLTIIGIPLGIVLMFAYVFAIYINGIFPSIVIGKNIFDRIGKANISIIIVFLLGLFVLELVRLIPILGGLIRFIVVLWSFGAIISTRFGNYKEAREKGII